MCVCVCVYTHIHVNVCIYIYIYLYLYGFPSGPVVKNLPAMQKTQVWSLDLKNIYLYIYLLSTGTSLEGPLLKLKFQYFGHLMQRTDSFEKNLTLGKIEAGGEGDDRGWDGWMASPTRWTWVWINSGSWWWTGRPGLLQSMELQRVGNDWATELNWKCGWQYGPHKVFVKNEWFDAWKASTENRAGSVESD